MSVLTPVFVLIEGWSSSRKRLYEKGPSLVMITDAVNLVVPKLKRKKDKEGHTASGSW